MSAIEQFKKLGRGVLDLVFPITCLVCGKDGAFLCANCYTKLPRLEKQKCVVCRVPSPFGKTHPYCTTRNVVDGMLASAPYADKNIKNIIGTFKYSFVFALANPLTDLMVETIKSQNLDNYFEEFTIVPVPLHLRRFNWRGFNQAELLADTLASKLNLSVDDSLVSRKKFTEPQTQLTAEERKRNMENVFVLNKDTSNKKILLIDDVVTSGSTANELAKLLKAGKASEVWVISVAHG